MPVVWLVECFAGAYDEDAQHAEFYFQTKTRLCFSRASSGYTASITSATVNAFVVFSGENDLQNRLPLHFSRFAAQDRFDISQTVVKTAFVAA